MGSHGCCSLSHKDSTYCLSNKCVLEESTRPGIQYEESNIEEEAYNSCNVRPNARSNLCWACCSLFQRFYLVALKSDMLNDRLFIRTLP